MNIRIKSLFLHYLSQLVIIISKKPSDLFALVLSEDMLSLEENAKVAPDFVGILARYISLRWKLRLRVIIRSRSLERLQCLTVIKHVSI